MCTHLPALEPLISVREFPTIVYDFRKPHQRSLNTFLLNSLKPYPVRNQHKSNLSLKMLILTRSFVVTEGLKKIQEIKAGPGSKLR